MARTVDEPIRFVVGSLDGCRAGTWRCWTPGASKNDVYLGPRSIAGEFKASLHETGSWHLAFSSEFKTRMQAEGRWIGRSRLTRQWQRPKALAPGCVLAFRVLVPSGAVNIPSNPKELPTDLVWIPAPPVGMVVEIALFLTAPGATVSGWPGKRSMSTGFVGNFPLPSGEVVWLVHREDSMPALSSLRGSISTFEPSESFRENLDGKRAVVLIEAEGEPAALLETSVEDKRPVT